MPVRAVFPKVAVTVVRAFNVIVQVPVPEQPPPLHPPKPGPEAVSVTDVPLLNEAIQVAPQLIPAGLDVTVPVPATTIDSVGRLKAAETDALAVSVRLQVGALPVETQSPPQPLNNEVAAGVATMVKAVPEE
jgi:hypothetical protein